MRKRINEWAQRISDWSFRKFSRRPPGRLIGYYSILATGMYAGIFIGLGILVAGVLTDKHHYGYAVLLGGLCFAFAAYWVLLVAYPVHKQNGYIDALDRMDKERWRTRAEKLGMLPKKEA